MEINIKFICEDLIDDSSWSRSYYKSHKIDVYKQISKGSYNAAIKSIYRLIELKERVKTYEKVLDKLGVASHNIPKISD